MPSPININTLGFLVTDVSRLMRAEFERRISTAGLGITPGEARAMLHVSAHPGKRQNELAERMMIEPMTLCRYLDRLEGAELVQRLADPGDRRAKNIEPTEQGQQLTDEIRRHTAAMIEEVQAGLDDAQRAALKEALLVVQSNLINGNSKLNAANG